MKSRRILVVDDERIVAQDISECLIQMGCEVCGTALSGSEAIFKAGELSPDLILMDVVLQGDMDGIDAAKIIRERFDIPCVFLTAYSDEGVLSRAKLTEPAGYIVKPFEESGLRSTVEIALHKVDTEKALRESHEWFATTLMSIGDGVIATNKEGMIRFMNPVAESLTGWKSEEAAGSHLSEIFRIFNERTRQPAKNPALIALESGLTENLEDEAVLVCRDNSIIPIDDSGAPIRDRHERVVGAVLVFRDMTEQRAAAAKIKQHQEHLEELVQERTCELTQKNELLESQIEERRRAEAALERQMGAEALLAGLSSQFLQLKPVDTPQGIADGLARIGKFLRIEAAYVLRPRAAGNDALECPFEWVAQGRQSAAPQCATLSHESIGITADFYDRRQPAVFSARGALGTARGAATILAVPISAGDSSFGLLCVDSANPERRWTREDAALLGMVGDLFVTAIRRQRAEEDKQRLQMQLNQSQKMEAVGKLSGGIAHDLNNMLLPVIGYSDMLLARVPENSPDALELLEIRRAAEHAASLTRQLLAFSKKQVVKKTTTGINDVIQKMGKILDRVIGENIKIHFNLSEGLPPVLADPSQMEQVIMNLVVNARDAMPEGGSVSIRTRQVDTDSVPAKLISGAKPNGAFVEIIVRDTGRGIPKEIMDEIFDPFFTTKGHEGTGLGLHVVRSILEEHSGGIRVESYPGEGSEFHLFLPATSGSQPFAQAPRSSEAGYASTSAASPLPPAETPSPAVTRPPAETRGSGERILLVEDEESVIRFVARALKQHGYEVIEAMCVRDALDTFAEHGGRFDLVFSDAVLPDGNGVALLDQFLKERPDLPVVLSSGYTDKRSLLELAKERDIRFLQKPYALPLLFQTVRDALLNEGKAALA